MREHFSLIAYSLMKLSFIIVIIPDVYKTSYCKSGHIYNEHAINMERFAGLNFCSFNAIEVFTEILSHCLAKRAYYLICGYTMVAILGKFYRREISQAKIEISIRAYHYQLCKLVNDKHRCFNGTIFRTIQVCYEILSVEIPNACYLLTLIVSVCDCVCSGVVS